jgi:hypothetical protein
VAQVARKASASRAKAPGHLVGSAASGAEAVSGGGGAVAVERQVVQGEVPAARSAGGVRVAQVRPTLGTVGGGAAGEEREVAKVQVPARSVRLLSERAAKVRLVSL